MLGCLSLGSFELNYLSIREIFNAWQGYKQDRQYQKEILWEAIGRQTLELVNISGKYLKHPLTSRQQLIQFEWDKKQPRHKKMSRRQQLQYQKNRIYARSKQ